MLLAVFVGGIANCLFACSSEDADDHCAAQNECHCIVHCDCHTLSLFSSGSERASVHLPGVQLFPEPSRVKLPLLADSIFNPPRA